MAPVNNRFSKYVGQQNTTTEEPDPAKRQNRFSRFVQQAPSGPPAPVAKGPPKPMPRERTPWGDDGQAFDDLYRYDRNTAAIKQANAPNPITTEWNERTRQAQRAYLKEQSGPTPEEIAKERRANSAALSQAVGEMGVGGSVMGIAPTQTFDPEGRTLSQGDVNRSLGVRFAGKVIDAIGPGTANFALELGDAMFGPGPAYDMLGNPLKFDETRRRRSMLEIAMGRQEPVGSSPESRMQDMGRISFGTPQDRKIEMLPTTPLAPPKDEAEMIIDLGGTLVGALLGGGKAVPREAGLGRVATQIGAKGTTGAKALGYGTRMAGNVGENVGYAALIGANMAPEGQRVEMAGQLVADPLTWALGPALSAIYRSSIGIATLGARVTPQSIQLQQARQILLADNATDAQKQAAIEIIDRMTPPVSPQEIFNRLSDGEKQAVVQRMQDAGMSRDDIIAAIRRGDMEPPVGAGASQSAPAEREPMFGEIGPFGSRQQQADDIPPAPEPEPVRAPEPPPRAAEPAGTAPFSRAGQALPQRGNPVLNNADRIGGAFIGASIASPSASASSGDGQGSNPLGTAGGAAVGYFLPRAFRNAFDRVWLRGTNADKLALRTIERELRAAGLNNPQAFMAQYRAMYGDKPAAPADIARTLQGMVTSAARLPGDTGDVARGRMLELREGSPQRAIDDASAAFGQSPANIEGGLEAMQREARSQAGPAYERVYANNPRLEPEYGPGTRAEEQLRAVLANDRVRRMARPVDEYATAMSEAGRPIGQMEYMDKLKQEFDTQIRLMRDRGIREGDIELETLKSLRARLVQAVDDLVPDYRRVREVGGEAPQMAEAFDRGASAFRRDMSVSQIRDWIGGLTGQNLTAAQLGVLQKFVTQAENTQGALQAMMTPGARAKLAEVFTPQQAENFQARLRAELELMNNAARMAPGQGSVTSEAMGGVAGLAQMVSQGIDAVRNPTQAALDFLSKTGGMNRAQRDAFGRRALEPITEETARAIYRSRPPRGRRGGPPPAAQGGPPPAAGGAPSPGGRGPDPTSQSPAFIGGAGVGALTGAAANPDDPAAGALLGAGLGGVAGGLAGRLAGRGGPPPRRLPPGRGIDAMGMGGGPRASSDNVIRQAEAQGYQGRDIGEAKEWVNAREKGLDMSQPARMERARGQGFNVDEPLYHGTKRDFAEFRVSEDGNFGPGVYLTRNPRDASEYAGAADGSNVRPVYVRGRLADEEAWGDAFEQVSQKLPNASTDEWDRQAVALLKKRGYDGIDGDGQISIFNPANIRSVNAAFDPSQARSSNILAGIRNNPAATGVVAGGALGAVVPYDTDGDGVIDANDRAASMMGNMITGGIAGAAAGRLMPGAARRGPPTGPSSMGLGGRGASRATSQPSDVNLNNDSKLSEIIQRGRPIAPTTPTPTASAVASALADTRTSGAATSERLDIIVPEADRVVGGTYTPGAPGGGKWTDLSPDFLEANGPGFNVSDDELMELWRQSVQMSSQAAKNSVKANGVVPTFMANDWNEAMQLPYRDMLWYELSGEAIGTNLPDLTAREFIHAMDVVGATSARAKPDENLERTLSVISQNMQGGPIDVDLTQPPAVNQALSRRGLGSSALPGNKTGHFSDTLALTGGVPTRYPISVNDVWVGKMFGISDAVMSKNQSLHEPMAIYFNKIRDLYNRRHGAQITEAMRSANPQLMNAPPFNLQSWNFQAPAWVHIRGQATGDAYHQVWDDIIDKLNDAGIPGIVGQKITREALMHPGFADALRRTAGPWRNAPKATVEFGTKLTNVGKSARERYDRAVEAGDLRTQKEYLKPIMAAMYASARGKNKPWDLLKDGITGRKGSITRIDYGTQNAPLDVGGSFDGDLSPNIRIPLKGMTDDEIADFNAFVGEDLLQEAMAASQVLPANLQSASRPGYTRGLSLFVATIEPMDPSEIRAFAKALDAEGHTISYNRYPNGYKFDINPNFGDDGVQTGIDGLKLDEAFNNSIGTSKYGTPNIIAHDYKSVYTVNTDYAGRVAAVQERIVDDFAKATGLSKARAKRDLSRTRAPSTYSGTDRRAWNTARRRVDNLASARAQFKALAEQVENGHVNFLERTARRDARADKARQRGQTTLSAFPGAGNLAQAGAGVGGAAYGYARGSDINEDGVIDDQERMTSAVALGVLGLGTAGLARAGMGGRARPPSVNRAGPPVKANTGSGKSGKPPSTKGPPTLAKIAKIGAGGVIGAGVAAGGYAAINPTKVESEETRAALKKSSEDIFAAENRVGAIQKQLDEFAAITDPREKQEFLKTAGYYAGKIDGNIAGRTTEGINQWIAAKQTELKEVQKTLDSARLRRTQAEMKSAFERTNPGPSADLVRELIPWIGTGAGIVVATLGRRGAVKKVAQESSDKAAKVNRLVSDATPSTMDTMVGRKALGKRATNLNEFWFEGGAGKPANLRERLGIAPPGGVPFKTVDDPSDLMASDPPGAVRQMGDWMGRSNVRDAWELFKPGSKYLKAMDVGVIGAAIAEAEFSGNLARGFKKEEEEAKLELQAAKDANDAAAYEIAMNKLENAKTGYAVATAFERFGQLAAAFRVANAFKQPYKYVRPNIKKAEADRALILDAIRRSYVP